MKNYSNSREENLQEISEAASERGGIPKKILDVLPIGICITDQNGYYKYANSHYLEIYGYEKEELIGQHFTIMVPDQAKQDMDQLHHDFICQKEEMHGEWEVRRKNGEKFKILSSATYLKDDETGEPIKMTFVVDMASFRITTDNLNATVEMLRRKLDAQELAQYISNHDMRNNLGNISQLAELLSKTKLDKKQQQWVEIIQKLSLRTLNMLKMSADFVKMEQGHYEPETTELDLLDLLFTELEAFAKERKNRGIRMVTLLNGTSTDYAHETLMIQGDRLYIERLFSNLIGNALDATPNQGQIQVEVKTENQLQVSIHNPNPIPEQLRDSFFDKFATSGKQEGTGLGTYIAKLVTELHGGTIHFITSEEQGTTLLVDFPQAMIQSPN
jgi:PAS domain S-box-containing protein